MPARPSVNIIQNLATLPTGNVPSPYKACIIGPAYDVYKDIDPIEYASGATVPYYTLGVDSTEKVDISSVSVSLHATKVEILSSTATAVAGDYFLTDPNVTSNITEGDTLIIGSGTNAVTFYVTSVDVANEKINVAQKVPADIATAEAYTVYREADETVDITALCSPVTDTELTLPAPSDITLTSGTLSEGTVKISMRALIVNNAYNFIRATSSQEIEATIGKIDFDNDLGLAAYIALATTGTEIYYMPLDSDSDSAYLTALSELQNHDVVTVATLSESETVMTAVKSHADAMSTPEEHKWRRGYIGSNITYTSTTVADADCVVSNSVLTDSNAKFITGDKKFYSGDTVIITDTSSGEKTTTTINSIANDNEIVLEDLSINITAGTYSVVHNLSKDELVIQQKAAGEAYGSRRLVRVFCDSVDFTYDLVTKKLSSVYAAVAIAALDAALPIQHGMTNIGIPFDNVYNTSFYFTRTQLDTISDGGNLILIQDVLGGPVIIRHALTTDVAGGLLTQEILETRIIDGISHYFYKIFQRYPGNFNITDNLVNNVIPQEFDLAQKYLQNQTIPRYGAPIISATLNTIERSGADSIYSKIDVVLPKPLNRFTIDIYAS